MFTYQNTFTFIDLFAGIGGFRLALESFGLKCVFSSESNKYAWETYSANFGETPHGDITKIDSQEIPNKPVQIGIINKGGRGERIYQENGHAITLLANGGGVARKTGAYLINGKIRKFSPRECTKIMGFPEDFKIPVSDAQAYKDFGNTVAIPVIKAVFKKILKYSTVELIRGEI